MGDVRTADLIHKYESWIAALPSAGLVSNVNPVWPHETHQVEANPNIRAGVSHRIARRAPASGTQLVSESNSVP